MSNAPSSIVPPSSYTPVEPSRPRTIGRSRSSVELSEDEQTTLKTLVRQHTLTGAARKLRVSRAALATALAGGDSRDGTVLQLQHALRALTR